ncbi:protein of unknown function [Actinopolymorpha cephalotaxi]|uniref:DUF4037 domain-containing protein n=1 Tax=Actinopolymorpha cephalotaxi TaxID=504797 RepID=A0A1I2LAE4_9ACTN|nr:DUF4037 domain-containing protein [Actinopolymorpha cephalotaxi]NYH84984.1 hypothetical protein [Actinopolymorpha cephalotaxi]SFF76352.1 protein of unknown function [Actinopolymorpha cephalotaxi]
MTAFGSGFVSGRELSARFYHEAVRPVLDARFPGLPHSAALLGRGSEVLGFDDEMSADHDWDARVLLFLREEDHARHGEPVEDALRSALPARFGDRPTKYELHTLRGYVLTHLGFDLGDELTAHDWLTFPEDRLRMLTAGAVHHDDIGLQAVRDRFAYYPHDVWLYLLLAGWWRVHPEANLVGRTGFAGDELGSALIGAQLVHDLMSLCFLMERQYAPYSKWFGTAFSRLACGADLSPVLTRALRAEAWPEREEALAVAYEKVAALHNALGVTDPVATEVHRLWNRPFKVVWGDFPGALRAQIRDPAVERIARRWPVGRIDQVRDLLPVARRRQELLRLYDEPDAG